jgi:hypothetical protein
MMLKSMSKSHMMLVWITAGINFSLSKLLLLTAYVMPKSGVAIFT